MIWTASDGDGKGVWGQRYDAEGTPVGPIYQLNTEIAGDAQYSKLTVLEDGRLVASWITGGTYYGQVLDATGQPEGAEFAIGDYNISPRHPMGHDDLAALEDGGFVAVWTKSGADGSQWGVVAQRYDAQGNAVGEEFVVNSYTGSYQQTPEVTGLKGGGYVVTWLSVSGTWGGDSGGGIFAQQYDAAGDPVNGEFHVNTSTAGLQIWSKTVAMEDGGFTVLWRSSLTEFRMQRYAEDGATVGTEAVLQTGAPAHDTYYSDNNWQVIELQGGGYAAMWRSTLGNTFHIQSFDDSGAALTEVQDVVPSHAAGDGVVADLIQLEDGRLVMTWHGNENNNIYTTYLDAPPPVEGNYLTQSAELFSGSAEDEIIFGLTGDDTIYGGGGNDRLIGGGGNDLLTGGVGSDTFVFGLSSGTDAVTDFEVETDLIEIDPAGMLEGTGFADLVLTDFGNDLRISFSDPSINTVIYLNNLSTADLTEGDVIFA